MVDAVDLRFGEDRAERVVDRDRAGAVVADRLFHHHAGVGAGQAMRLQARADAAEQVRADREVEHADPRLVGQFGRQLGPAGVGAEVDAAVTEHLQERFQRRGRARVVGQGLLQGFADAVAVGLVGQGVAGQREDAGPGDDLAVDIAMEQGRQQLAQGQVARAAEDDQIEGRHRRDGGAHGTLRAEGV